MTVDASSGSVARAREHFFESSGRITLGVRQEIQMSWLRSRAWGVEPSAGGRFVGFEGSRSRLMRAAGRVLDAVMEDLGELDVSVILADSDARVIDRRTGDRRLTRLLDRVDMAPGFVFSEEVCGTNGLGTPIETGQLVKVGGHEHFIDGFVEFSCIGAPITDGVSKRVVGVIDVTTSADSGGEAAGGLLARQLAKAIEAELRRQRFRGEHRLLDHYLEETSRTRGAVVAIGERLVISNAAAAQLLWSSDLKRLRDRALWATSQARSAEADGADAGITSTSYADVDGHTVGAVFRMAATERHVASRVPHGTDHALPASDVGLVGAHQDFLAAYQMTATASPQVVTALVGEPGSGKHALALAGAHAAGMQATTIDCAVEEARHLQAELKNRTDLSEAVIFRHVNSPGAASAPSYAAVVRDAVESGKRVFLTFATEPGWGPGLLPDVDVVTVPVPALRERASDIPVLARHLAAGRDITDAAVRVLQRALWPGNIRELEQIVSAMTRDNPGDSPLDVEHIPVGLRRFIPHRPLTRLERAELMAILDALAATGSKKAAARDLGLSRSTLYRRLLQYGVDLDVRQL
ncbi:MULTISPECIES: helix-turn-helix domain-containing protein [unclassified Microbacterium]|uniref:helix-turn-helix domain-containing protein n=1 Tax=unclassified Microbacterium TaxID=2609290 RepID=UPI000F635078|nr:MULTISPECIES: helix-turn-helix domain-containing protein [unclassified Microbacterium]